MPSATICNARWEVRGVKGSCDKPVFAKGLCSGHYRRRHRGLDVNVPLREPLGDHVFLCGINVTLGVHVALQDEAKALKTTPYEVHQTVMEEWARQRRREKKRDKQGGA